MQVLSSILARSPAETGIRPNFGRRSSPGSSLARITWRSRVEHRLLRPAVLPGPGPGASRSPARHSLMARHWLRWTTPSHASALYSGTFGRWRPVERVGRHGSAEQATMAPCSDEGTAEPVRHLPTSRVTRGRRTPVRTLMLGADLQARVSQPASADRPRPTSSANLLDVVRRQRGQARSFRLSQGLHRQTQTAFRTTWLNAHRRPLGPRNEGASACPTVRCRSLWVCRRHVRTDCTTSLTEDKAQGLRERGNIDANRSGRCPTIPGRHRS